MNTFLILAFLFFIGCTLGWVLELLFRRFVSKNNPQRRWINPGFLIGPYLPLYGSGLVILYLLANIQLPILPVEWMEKVFVFIAMAIAMTLIEYITGLVFIKRMNVKLWDYTEEWGNIQGIICPKFSLAWALLGAGYYFLVHPYILEALQWLSENLAFSFVIGFFFGVFIIDVCYSMNILGKVRAFADEYQIIVLYDELKAQIEESRKYNRQKRKFLFVFGTEQPLREHLKSYQEKLELIPKVVMAGRKQKKEK